MMTKDANAIIEKYARLAGFQAMVSGVNEGAPALPMKNKYWQSDYAEILVLEIVDSLEDSLREACQLGQEWLDVSCMKREASIHRVIDAYLLILIPTKPPESSFGTIRDIELNPVSCRKHVAWPSKGDDPEIVWRRVLRVTALGLPASPRASGMTNSPKLETEFAKDLLRDVKELKGAPAGRQHSEAVRAAEVRS